VPVVVDVRVEAHHPVRQGARKALEPKPPRAVRQRSEERTERAFVRRTHRPHHHGAAVPGEALPREVRRVIHAAILGARGHGPLTGINRARARGRILAAWPRD